MGKIARGLLQKKKSRERDENNGILKRVAMPTSRTGGELGFVSMLRASGRRFEHSKINVASLCRQPSSILISIKDDRCNEKTRD